MELTHSTPQRMRINRDGTRLVTLTTNDSSAHLWDLSAGRLVTDLPGAVSDVQFSEDGDYFVTATVDSTPRVWSAASGDRLLELVGGTSEVRKVAFSRDGLFIASGSEDGTIRVWNAHSGRNLLLLRAHSKRVNALSFSPDGRRIVSASEDKTAKVFACEVCVPRDELLRLAKDRSSVELESSQRSTTEPLGLPLRAPGRD